MKTEKLSLKAIKNALSRAEMRKITAGSGTGGGGNCIPLDNPCCYNNCGEGALQCCGGACWPDGPGNTGLCVS